jgi:hypothetical protein
MTENIALCIGPQLVHVVEPDIDTDLPAPLRLSRSCREDSLVMSISTCVKDESTEV